MQVVQIRQWGMERTRSWSCKTVKAWQDIENPTAHAGGQDLKNQSKSSQYGVPLEAWFVLRFVDFNTLKSSSMMAIHQSHTTKGHAQILYSLQGFNCCIWHGYFSVLPSAKLQSHEGNEKAWVFSTIDFADEEQKNEMFCIRFGSVESKRPIFLLLHLSSLDSVGCGHFLLVVSLPVISGV